MKNLLLFSLPLFFLAYGCDRETVPRENGEEVSESIRRDTCRLDGIQSILRGNRITDYLAEEIVVLRDPGEDNWRLEVYDLYSCETKAVYQLPPNQPADYPYFLADIIYNNAKRQVGIRANRELYIVDLDAGQMSAAFAPQYPDERLVDTESGTILHLEVWENYLVGATMDWGSFVFRFDNLEPVTILPVAELSTEEGFHSLFLIETEGGLHQAIIPEYDANTGLFMVNPVFPDPVNLDVEATVYAEGSPYVRLRKKGGSYVGIDLRTAALLPVIEERVPE